MRKPRWILHGEKDSLNALGEMKLVPLMLSEPSSKRDQSLPITCTNQIPSSCSPYGKFQCHNVCPALLWALSPNGHGLVPRDTPSLGRSQYL